MENSPLTSPFFWIPLLMGVLYYILGYIMIKYPPRDRNGFYGYRTPRAKKSEKNWVFAQKFSAIMLKKFGMLCLPFCTLGMISDGKSEIVFVILITAIALFPAIIVIYLTEKFLKEV